MTSRTFRVALAGAVLCASAAPALANLIQNGDFESPTLSPTSSAYIVPTGPLANTWTVLNGEVQHVGSSFAGLNGFGSQPSQWVDLTGGNEGYNKGIQSNTFVTTPGAIYSLTFAVGAMTGRGNAYVDVLVNGTSLAGNYFSNATASPMNWTPYTVNFTATAPTTFVSFLGRNFNGSSDSVIGLDAVAAVPEPHEWAMMLAGLGLVGWAARRSKRQAVAPMPAAA